MSIKLKAGFGFEGRFTLTARNPDGSVRLIREFKNLITDLGLNGIGTNGASWATNICLGTGTATPNVADTALSGTVISVTGGSGTSGDVAVSPRYSWSRWTRAFAQGAATGIWTEIGIGRTSTALWSRALILDGLGAPTSLPIIATDILTVEYELRVYYNEADVTGTREISGVSTSYIVRPYQARYDIASKAITGTWMSGPSIDTRPGLMVWNGALNAAWAGPAGAAAGGFGSTTPYTVGAYVSSSYEKVVVCTCGISELNVAGGITVAVPMLWGDYFDGGATPFKFGFTPGIAKDATKIMSLTFSFSWARRA